MEVRVVCEDVQRESNEKDYVRVCTYTAPDDDTLTLATIQRIVDKSHGATRSQPIWRVKTLVLRQPMSPDQALGLATRYAERKGIPVVYAEQE